MTTLTRHPDLRNEFQGIASSATVRTIAIALIALVPIFLAAYLVMPSMENVAAQDGGTATATGNLVVVPGVVEIGQTILAVGFHVEPADIEVKIEYSEHFTTEDETCDTAGTAGSTEVAVAPTWITLNACTVGEGYVRLVESTSGNLIEESSVTVTEPLATGQQSPSVRIGGLTSSELVPGGSEDEFWVSAAGLDSGEDYELHTVVLNSLSAAFNEECTTFRESDSITGLTSAIEYYDVYGCVAPGNRIWSYVDDEDGRAVTSTSIRDNEVNVADPTVSFSQSSYETVEGSDIEITVELSHPSSHVIRIPISVTRGTAETSDYTVDGLSSTGSIFFRNRSTSESFTIETTDDDEDEDDETVNLRFGTLPSNVSGTGDHRRATLTIEDNDENQDPYITTRITPLSFDECGEGTVAIYSATDPDGDPITWSLQSSRSYPDRGDFDIEDDELSDDGILTFDDVPNFEDPDDSDKNNEYKIMIRARDGKGGSDERNVTVTVRNLRPTIAPVQGSLPYAEGRTNRVARFSAADPCGGDITWSLPATSHATDAADFAIDRHGDLTFRVTPDFENPHDSNRRNDYKVTIRASDGELAVDKNVTVNVTDVNEIPDIEGPDSPSWDEGDTGVVATYMAEDPEDDDISWTLGGTDASRFRISENDDGDGELRFRLTPDFENPRDASTPPDNDYEITVIANDGRGGSGEIDVTVTVDNLAPTIPAGPHWLDYDEGGTAPVATYEASDPGGGDISWSLEGADARAFTIDEDDGELEFASTPDHENPGDSGPNPDNEYEVTVIASDAGDETSEKAVTIRVMNLPPTITSSDGRVEYDENGTDAVKQFEASDPGGGDVSWSLRGADAGAFSIDEDDGELEFASTPDYENPGDTGPNPDNDYDITIRASDASGETNEIEVTIRVNDVNEAPGVPSPPSVTSDGQTSLNVTWSEPTNTGPPINDYDVQYRVGSSGPFTSAAHAGTATQTTISDLDPGTSYQVQVRAKNPEGTGGWSDSGTGSTDAPSIEVTITASTPSVGEGQLVPFTLTADPAPTTNLTVDVSVTESGSFLTGAIPTDVTIAAGNDTASFTLRTSDDMIAEVNGTVTVTIQSGTGYIVGSPKFANVTVRDDDPPPVPTGLRANGDLDGRGNVTLRWNAVSGATGYNVRYTEETCNSDGVCDPDEENWTILPYTAGTTATVNQANLGGLTEAQLYRVEVQAEIAVASDWSEFALVFPTDSPLRGANVVATAPFHGYHAKNARGSHEFRYVLCEETIPGGLTMTARDMKNAIDEWEDTVTWDRSGANIISTSSYELPAGEQCTTGPSHPFQDPYGEGLFQVRFVSNADINNALCVDIFKIFERQTPGCWRSPSWTTPGIGPIEEGSVLLNAGLGSATWNLIPPGGGCTQLHELIVHEIGHALGIGSGLGWDYNHHPINTEHSVMSYDDSDRDCEPQAYDIVALMALYQSR